MNEKNQKEQISKETEELAKKIAKDLANHAEQIDTSKTEETNPEVESLKEENAKLQDTVLRNIAEMQNLRKRMEKQNEDTAKYAISNMAKELLSVIDNLSRACDSIPIEKSEEDALLKTISDGLKMTQKEFMSVLEKFGIELIRPDLGSNFDHNFHQAVVHIDSESYPSGSIANVMQDGYKIHDRLLRPCMVAVAK